MNAPQVNNLDADTEFKMQAALAARNIATSPRAMYPQARIDRSTINVWWI